VTPFVVLRHHPLIHLKDLHVVPVNVQAAQVTEHPPHRAPAAEGNEAATALRARMTNPGA
jgi:hypothetical protein